jgi:hypothetical protein
VLALDNNNAVNINCVSYRLEVGFIQIVQVATGDNCAKLVSLA